MDWLLLSLKFMSFLEQFGEGNIPLVSGCLARIKKLILSEFLQINSEGTFLSLTFISLGLQMLDMCHQSNPLNFSLENILYVSMFFVCSERNLMR